MSRISKAAIRAVLATALLAVPLWASLSDSAALRKTEMLWGRFGAIGNYFDQDSRNWTRQVGIQSPGCQAKFTVLGEGFNTWDAAFDNAAAHPIAIPGPFADTIQLAGKAGAYDPIKRWQRLVDGKPFGDPIVKDPPVDKLDVTEAMDTTAFTNGWHVLCAEAEDTAGNIGRTPAHLIMIGNPVTSRAATLTVIDPAARKPGRWHLACLWRLCG